MMVQSYTFEFESDFKKPKFSAHYEWKDGGYHGAYSTIMTRVRILSLSK